MSLIGKTRTRSGLRFDSPADTLSIDVEAFATPGDSVAMVEFEVSPEFDPPTTIQRPTRALRFPNYSTGSPIPGAIGGMAPIYSFGFSLDADAWPSGWIRVIPYIVSGGVTPRRQLDSVWVLNDSDGIDRRGSNVTVYANYQTGNDVNSGGILSPVKTIQRAIELSRNNPAGDGTSLIAQNCGGAKIIAEGVFSGVRAGGTPHWHTGDEWLTIEAGPAGARLNEAGSSDDWLFCRGVLGETTQANVRLIGFENRTTIQMQPGTNSNCKMRLWFDRNTMHNPFWVPEKRWSVRYREDAQDVGFWIPTTGAPRGDIFASCCHYLGVNGGPNNFTDSQDCRISDWTAIAIHSNGGTPEGSAINCLIEYQRYHTPDVWGFIDTVGNGNLAVSVPTAGTLRIEATGPLVQNGEPADLNKLSELIGASLWTVQLTDFGGGNDGRWPVTAAGVDFVELAVPGATATTPASTARMWTWGTAGIYGSGGIPLSYNELVHPDVLWLGSIQDAVFTNIACRDVKNAQGLFGSNTAKNRVVIYNFSDGGHGIASNFATAPWTDCILAQCSLSGPISFNPSVAGSQIVNNSWLQASGVPTNGLEGNQVDYNHTVNGPAQGAHGTVGPFFQYDTTIPPWSIEPIDIYLATMNRVAFDVPDIWAWPYGDDPEAFFPIGALANVGLYDWSQPLGFLSGSAAGGSSASSNLVKKAALSSTASGSGSGTANLNEKHVLSSFAQGFGNAVSTIDSIHSKYLSSSSSSASSSVSTLLVLRALSGTAAASSSSSSSLYFPGTVLLAGTAFGASLAISSLTVFINASDSSLARRQLMKQRIHNALVALVRTGAFYRCSINEKTGQMTIHTDKPIAPTGVVVKETRASFRPAARFRSAFNVSELQAWSWIARVSFSSEVSCEVFEDNVLAGGIKIPPVIGLDSQRTLLARLADSEYAHPPEQSPNKGTVVEFMFEVVTETLRK